MALLNRLFKKDKEKANPAKKVAAVPVAEKPKAAAAGAEKIREIKSDILLAPHLAEKALTHQSSGKYVFKVSPAANKIKVAKEIKKVFGVKVVGVNILNVRGKERRVGRTIGFVSGYKKAVVTLAKGQTIELAK